MRSFLLGGLERKIYNRLLVSIASMCQKSLINGFLNRQRKQSQLKYFYYLTCYGTLK